MPNKEPSKASQKEKKPFNAKSVPKSSAQIKQEEWDTFVSDSVISHAGWLTEPITNLSYVSGQSPIWISFYMALASLPILLAAPASWIPHVAAPITFLVPIQNTMRSMSLETKKGRGASPDSAQWAMYWTVWCTLGWIGGWIGVFKPGWRALWEIWKVAALIIVGGPWFGRASLRAPGPSKELQEAEKREEAEAQKAEKGVLKKEEKARKDAKEKEGRPKKAKSSGD